MTLTIVVSILENIFLLSHIPDEICNALEMAKEEIEMTYFLSVNLYIESTFAISLSFVVFYTLNKLTYPKANILNVVFATNFCFRNALAQVFQSEISLYTLYTSRAFFVGETCSKYQDMK